MDNLRKTIDFSLPYKRINGGIFAPFLLIIFLIGVALVGFYIWGWREIKSTPMFDISAGATTETKLIRLEIGDKVFDIPKNHIWFRAGWKDGRIDAVNLEALLPDFESRTKENWSEFEKPGWNQKVGLMLSEHSMPTSAEDPTPKVSMTRREVYNRVVKEQPPRNEPTAFGLTRQKFPDPKKVSSGDEIYIAKKPDGSFYWVRCSPEGKFPSPSCSTYADYSPHLYVKYTFSKNHLRDWLTIEKGAIALIQRFETPPQTPPAAKFKGETP